MSFDYTRGSGSSTTIPYVRQLAVNSGQSWLKGAPVIVSTGKYSECGADPAVIAGIALNDYGTAGGKLFPIGSKEFPPGYAQVVGLEDFQLWHCAYLGTVPTTVGSAYGITRDTDSKWKVDFAKTGATVTRVTLVDLAPLGTPAGSSGAILTPRVGVKFTPTANFTIAKI